MADGTAPLSLARAPPAIASGRTRGRPVVVRSVARVRTREFWSSCTQSSILPLALRRRVSTAVPQTAAALCVTLLRDSLAAAACLIESVSPLPPPPQAASTAATLRHRHLRRVCFFVGSCE